VKLGLLSYNSTIHSNHAVDLPIDIAVIRNGQTRAELTYRVNPGDSYYGQLDGLWSEALSAAIAGIPPPPYRDATRGASIPARPLKPDVERGKGQVAAG
jgi:putative proteasome-type protease